MHKQDFFWDRLVSRPRLFWNINEKNMMKSGIDSFLSVKRVSTKKNIIFRIFLTVFHQIKKMAEFRHLKLIVFEIKKI